jgi:crossover junction endodeoxyribonuclease RuvC
LRVWGIDPGNMGALALMDTSATSLVIFDTPTVQIGKDKPEIHIPLLTDILYEDANAPVFMEKVWARPGQGVTSMFNFGKGYGILLGIIGTLQMRLTLVTPQTWQKAVGGIEGKDGARYRASQLFPQQANQFIRKRDNGRADAALIAYYGAHHHFSKEP